MPDNKDLKDFMSKMVKAARNKKDHAAAALHDEQLFILKQINELSEVLAIHKCANESIAELLRHPNISAMFERSNCVMDILISPSMIKGIYLPFTGDVEVDKELNDVYNGKIKVDPAIVNRQYSLLPKDDPSEEDVRQWIAEHGILGRVVPAINDLITDFVADKIDSRTFETAASAIIFVYLSSLYEDSANIDFYSFREVDYVRKIICTTNYEYFLLPRKIFLVADYANTLKRDICEVADITLPTNRVIRYQFSRLANGAGSPLELFKAIHAWSEMVSKFLNELLQTTQTLMEDQTKPYMTQDTMRT